MFRGFRPTYSLSEERGLRVANASALQSKLFPAQQLEYTFAKLIDYSEKQYPHRIFPSTHTSEASVNKVLHQASGCMYFPSVLRAHTHNIQLAST